MTRHGDEDAVPKLSEISLPIFTCFLWWKRVETQDVEQTLYEGFCRSISLGSNPTLAEQS